MFHTVPKKFMYCDHIECLELLNFVLGWLAVEVVVEVAVKLAVEGSVGVG